MNGFGNRFMFVASRRSKSLPFGGRTDREREMVNHFVKRLRKAIEFAQDDRVMTFASEARDTWATIYRAEPQRGGLVGFLTARAHPQKLRLAGMYAILDQADSIGLRHVLAAEACWRYSVATVEHVFGALRGDTVQDGLLEGLRAAYPNGLTGTDQAALFRRNLKAGRLSSARKVLEHDGFIRTTIGESGERGGRPEIVSFAIPPENTNQHEQTNLSRFLRDDSSLSLSKKNAACSFHTGEATEPCRRCGSTLEAHYLSRS
jgi:hypothetical protein